MVVIRMARSGKKGDPIYKVMVADKGRPLTGRFLEKLGIYTPGPSGKLVLNQERFDHWVKLGAQPTERVKKVIKTHSAGQTGSAARNS